MAVAMYPYLGLLIVLIICFGAAGIGGAVCDNWKNQDGHRWRYDCPRSVGDGVLRGIAYLSASVAYRL